MNKLIHTIHPPPKGGGLLATEDKERRIREDNEYFKKTGINRPPVAEYDPLVPINGTESPDIADDGDSYDENQPSNNHTASGEYSEDSPSHIIDPEAYGNLGSKKKPKKDVSEELAEDLLHFHGIDVKIPSQSNKASKEEKDAYIQREKIKQEKEIVEKAIKTKKKFKNAITGLELD